MPSAVSRNERVRGLRSPRSALVGVNARMSLQHSIHYIPCGFDCIFACEQRAIAVHRIGQEPFVRRFLAWLLVREVESALLSDKFLPHELYPRNQCNRRTGIEPEAH